MALEMMLTMTMGFLRLWILTEIFLRRSSNRLDVFSHASYSKIRKHQITNGVLRFPRYREKVKKNVRACVPISTMNKTLSTNLLLLPSFPMKKS